MARSKSSGRWLKEHFEDEFVKRSRKEGYRSRAVYKLEEIQQKDRVLKPGMTVVDLGAAPGGWSQYARKVVGRKGRVVAMDILDMEPLDGVDFIRGDFREDEALRQLMDIIGDGGVDFVMSDMAPNISGIVVSDQAKSMYLAELALMLARDVLRPGGSFLTKLFQGEGFDDFLKELRGAFGRVTIRKPRASRPRSREVYALARNFKL
jgi:23S rRNA (uridine2552-2'-O)-methyltransferase